MRELAALVGGGIILIWAATGAYVWLRYGWAGVALLWQSRKAIQGHVQTEVEQTVGGPTLVNGTVQGTFRTIDDGS